MTPRLLDSVAEAFCRISAMAIRVAYSETDHKAEAIAVRMLRRLRPRRLKNGRSIVPTFHDVAARCRAYADRLARLSRAAALRVDSGREHPTTSGPVNIRGAATDRQLEAWDGMRLKGERGRALRRELE